MKHETQITSVLYYVNISLTVMKSNPLKFWMGEA